MTCATSGKPKPNIKWTKVGSSDFLYNASLLAVVNVTRPGTANSRIQYQCIASNGVGTPATATASIIVNCKYVGKIVIHCALLFNVKYFSPFLCLPSSEICFDESAYHLFFLLFLLQLGDGFSSVLEIIYDPAGDHRDDLIIMFRSALTKGYHSKCQL